MIARLAGKLVEASADGAIVDVQGVGYQVQASARTLDALGPIGGDVVILTELQVREDGFSIDQIVLSPDTYLSAAPSDIRADNGVREVG